jgi:hypothetical protein
MSTFLEELTARGEPLDAPLGALLARKPAMEKPEMEGEYDPLRQRWNAPPQARVTPSWCKTTPGFFRDYDFGSDDGCVIATAAAGCPRAWDVQLTRRFRDEWFYQRSWGREAMAVYYRVAPGVAAWIRPSRLLRRLTRIGLVIPCALFSLGMLDRGRPRWLRAALIGATMPVALAFVTALQMLRRSPPPGIRREP